MLGHTRCVSTYLLSATTSKPPKILHSPFIAHVKKCGIGKKLQRCSTRKWTWLLVISTVLLGDAPPKFRFSASLKKLSPIVNHLVSWLHTIVFPRTVLGMWADVCGFIKLSDSDGRWKVRQPGPFSILHSPRSSGHLADRSELPSRGMKPPGFLCNGAMVKRIKKDTNDDSSRKNARRRVLQTKLQNAPSQEYFFDSSVPNRSCFFFNKLSIYNWNPGPRRGKEGAIEKQSGVKWWKGSKNCLRLLKNGRKKLDEMESSKSTSERSLQAR